MKFCWDSFFINYLPFVEKFFGTPFVVTQLLKNVVDGGKPFDLNSNPIGFSHRRALASAARWAITAEKFTSNLGSTTDEVEGGVNDAIDRWSVVGDGGGGNVFEGNKSSLIRFFNSVEWGEEVLVESSKFTFW